MGESLALAVPASVVHIARTLEGAGFSTWCVGGAVRDALLGHAHLDWDLATAATPPQIRRLFKRTIPVGVEFGTVGVLDDHGTMHEVTTFRRDVQTDGRHAVVEFGASLEDDLARRDFTVNAIAYSPITGEMRDPFGGRVDLERQLVRAVGAPDDRMREDRLRALRAIRFAARFGFTIEEPTWRAIMRSAPQLGRLSAERVRQEVEKTMEQVERPSVAFTMWRESGAFATVIPSLATVSALTLATVDCVRRPVRAAQSHRRMDRIAGLFSEQEPARAVQALRALRFSKRDTSWIGDVLDRWHRVDGSMTAALLRPDPPADVAIRRWVALMGRVRTPSVLRLAAAHWGAMRGAGLQAPPAARVASLYRRGLRAAFHQPVELSDLAVDGSDLQAVGIPAGPELGRVLDQLLDVVIEDPARNAREPLLELARAASATLGGER
ncbi:MAG TPA: CCA tRNA nucleotidyltransferase [Gemmatimonadaceae bacterium]|nr:CCA tRNA nucleotidyltransferase [Gemmatimonadaceae bacterium]